MTVRLVQGSLGGDDPKSKLELDIGRLFDFALAHPAGFTHLEVELTYGWTSNYFKTVERHLRGTLASLAENLVCNPDEDNPSGPWIYRLTSDPELTEEWHANRVGDSETRLKTIMAVAESATHAHSGRTLLGKRARVLFKAASRALEDLEELREDSA